MTNISSIARALKISPSTVSRAIRRPDMVSLKTRTAVLNEARAQGYFEESAIPGAESAASRDNLIGIMVADLNNSFSDQIVSAVQDVAYAHDFVPLIGCHYENPSQESKIIKHWLELGLRGIVIMPTSNFAHLGELLSTLKVVLVDRDIESLECDKVLDDNYLGIKLAAEHLLSLGHQQIAFLTGPTTVDTFKKRAAAASELLPGAELLEINAVSYEELYMGAFEQVNILTMRERSRRPTAILAANNALAAGCLYACSLRGMRIPEDISVAAFGDSHWMRFYPIPVTAIRQPVQQMGSTAAYLLIDRIKGADRAFEQHILSPMLMPRSSTGSVHRQ